MTPQDEQQDAAGVEPDVYAADAGPGPVPDEPPGGVGDGPQSITAGTAGADDAAGGVGG